MPFNWPPNMDNLPQFEEVIRAIDDLTGDEDLQAMWGCHQKHFMAL